MISFNTIKDKIDRRAYEEALSINSAKLYINYFKFLKGLEVSNSSMLRLEEYLSKMLRYLSCGTSLYLDTAGIIKLYQMYGISEDTFRNKNTTRFSLDSKKILQPLLQGFKNQADYLLYCDIIDFTESYIYSKHLKTINGNARNVLSRAQQSDKVTRNGNKLSEVRFTYSQAQNNRYYTSNENVQGFAKEFLPTIEMPAGYIIVSADGAQADFREACEMLFLDDPEFREYYDIEDDKYKAMAKFIYHRAGVPFDEEDFKKTRKMWKEASLSTVYGKQDFKNFAFSNSKLPNTLVEFITKAPRYLEYVQVIKDAISFKMEVFSHDAFGSTSIWSANALNVEEEVRNAPIQAMTSAIVILWSMKILELFYTQGFTKDDIGILFNRHDECIFYMKEDLLDSYGWIFKECSEVAVDDWGKLEFVPSFCYNYTVEDEGLMERYSKSCESHKDLITPFKTGSKREKPYLPTGRVANVFCYSTFVAYNYLQLMNFPGVDLTVLDNYSRSQSEEKNNKAKEMLRDLFANCDENSLMYQQLKHYRDYNNLFVVKDNKNNIVTTCRTFVELKKYLLENDYGYVYLNNSILGDEVYADGELQFRYNRISEIAAIDILLSAGLSPHSTPTVEDVITDLSKPEVSGLNKSSLFTDTSTVENSTVKLINNVTVYSDEMRESTAEIYSDWTNLGRK